MIPFLPRFLPCRLLMLLLMLHASKENFEETKTTKTNAWRSIDMSPYIEVESERVGKRKKKPQA